MGSLAEYVRVRGKACVLRKFLWNTYDHLGTCVVLNILWLVVSTPWIATGYLLLVVFVRWLGVLGLVTSIVAGVAALWVNPASLALLAAASEWARYRTPDRAELWAAFRRRFVVGLWLSATAFGAAVVLGVNSAFYLQFPGVLRWVGFLLAGVMLWAQVAFLGVVFHLGLALARDRELSTGQGLRQALYLALKLPAHSLALGGGTLFLAAMLSLTQIGIPFVAMSVPTVFAATGERELLKRFRTPQPGQEEADRLEEVRSLRDLFRPWDMGR